MASIISHITQVPCEPCFRFWPILVTYRKSRDEVQFAIKEVHVYERENDSNYNDLSKTCQLGDRDRFVSKEAMVDDVFALDAPAYVLDGNPEYHEADKK